MRNILCESQSFCIGNVKNKHNIRLAFRLQCVRYLRVQLWKLVSAEFPA